MPLLFTKHPAEGATLGLWQIAEPESFFRENVPLAPAELAELAPYQGMRRLEWLAVRWLLHLLSGRDMRLPLAKDAFSKPFFPTETGLTCSLSHSHGLVGALLWASPLPGGRGAGVGCDIQILVEKMPRLAPRFLRAEEADFVKNHPPADQFALQHVFWTAKESLYKAYGLKALDFRKHLRVEPFRWENDRGASSGWVEKDAVRQRYQLIFELAQPTDAPPFVWTICLPAHDPR